MQDTSTTIFDKRPDLNYLSIVDKLRIYRDLVLRVDKFHKNGTKLGRIYPASLTVKGKDTILILPTEKSLLNNPHII